MWYGVLGRARARRLPKGPRSPSFQWDSPNSPARSPAWKRESASRSAISCESIAERFAVLAELRSEGLIRNLGVSNVDAAQLAEARGIAPVTAVQNRHTGDTGLLPECEEAGIAYVPYFPLGGGVGSGPFDAERLGRVAARLGATTAQVAIASLLAKSPSALAIPGTGSLDHLEENLAASDLRLRESAWLPCPLPPPARSTTPASAPRPRASTVRCRLARDAGAATAPVSGRRAPAHPRLPRKATRVRPEPQPGRPSRRLRASTDSSSYPTCAAAMPVSSAWS